MIALSKNTAELIWAIIALIFVVTIVCPAIYRRKK